MTQTIKNFLNDDEINTLYRVLALHANNGNAFEDSGRYIITPTEMFIPKDIVAIQNKIEKTATEIYGKNLIKVTSGFHIYSGKFGKPRLTPHIDDYAGEVVFDYQLDANVDWPLKIDKKEYSLNNNEAVIFEGEKTTHGRIEKEFQRDDIVIMYIVNLVSAEHWVNYTKKNPRPMENIIEEIKKIREDRENW